MRTWVVRPFYAVCGVFALTVIFDTVFFSSLMLYFNVISILMSLYAVVCMGLAVRKGKAQNLLAFIGLLVMWVLTVNDILFHNSMPVIQSVWGMRFTAPVGMVFFVFCYALLLALKYAETERVALESRIKEQALTVDNAMLDSLNRIKNDFLANISHEMRTPLTIMSGYAQQTRKEIENNEVNEETTQNLRVIQSEAYRLAELADQVLYTLKNLQTGILITPTQPIIILERASAICEPILARNGTRLERTAGHDCPAVAANLDMILQVLLNLCVNAGRHTKNGVVSITAKHAGDCVEFAVEDDGGGIAPELLPDVFERGVSGDDMTGLGLVICKDVIKQHGGTIDIASETSKGTRVVFTLPVAEEEKP
jgi:signal transduction histidine kinase